MMLKMALRVPVAPGVNITLIAQLEPPGKPLVQSLVWEKSDVLMPEKTTPLTRSMRSPVFVSVMTVGALGVETNCDEKVRLDGETDTAGGAVPRPVPVSAMVWGLAVALSVKSRDAVRSPFAVGEKVIATVHLVAGTKLVPQESEAI